MRAFLAQSEVSGDYDFSRITAVVDMIVSDCTVLRESVWIADPEAARRAVTNKIVSRGVV